MYVCLAGCLEITEDVCMYVYNILWTYVAPSRLRPNQQRERERERESADRIKTGYIPRTAASDSDWDSPVPFRSIMRSACMYMYMCIYVLLQEQYNHPSTYEVQLQLAWLENIALISLLSAAANENEYVRRKDICMYVRMYVCTRMYVYR